MLESSRKLVATLTELEPVFLQAGQLACKMQKGVKHHNKLNTGWSAVDIVTDADLAVQEFLLTAMAKTDLANCRLLAEEDTPLVNKFNKLGQYYLVIDPIDGTANYARNDKNFSVIVSLHDGKNLLYTFMHFPALNWTHRMIHNKYSVSGATPSLDLPPQAKNSITYYRGSPQKIIPELYQKLTTKGLKFVTASTLNPNCSIPELIICNKIAGAYYEDINAYDGLVALHYALTQGYQVHSGGPKGQLDLTDVKKRTMGFYYPGYYLVLA